MLLFLNEAVGSPQLQLPQSNGSPSFSNGEKMSSIEQLDSLGTSQVTESPVPRPLYLKTQWHKPW